MTDVSFFFGGWDAIARVLLVGTLGYAALVLLLRVSGKRTLAQMNAFDFVITVALGAAFGRVITAQEVALAEAVTAFALLIALQVVVGWMQLRSPRFARIVSAPPVLLYYRDNFRQDAMRRSRITRDQVRRAVREEGFGSLEAVEAVILEADGRFSVLRSERMGDRSAMARVDTEAPGEKPNRPAPRGRAE